MKIVYTHPTLTLSEKEYNAFETVRSILYELSVGTPYSILTDLFKDFDGNEDERDLIRNLENHIDDFYELAADFIDFINKYGKVTKED